MPTPERLDAARGLLERFFGLRCRYQRHKQIAIFDSDTGFEFAVSNLFDSPAPSYPPDFHVGFTLEHIVRFATSTSASRPPVWNEAGAGHSRAGLRFSVSRA